jgi:tRNA (guanine37-N1)-methyltransferase
MAVPEVLLGGNHAEIARWRREQSLRKTKKSRPDLLEKLELSERDRAWLDEN